MSDYGVQSTGYVRKPTSVILAEIEAAMITEFGSGVIQTPQSPLGQINGLITDLVTEIEQRNLDIYQSYDPDQAEGTRLDSLGRLRLLSRGDADDETFRKVITNVGQARADVQDLARAISGLDDVTFSQVFVNETGEVTDEGLERGSVSIAVIGGSDDDLAETIRRYVVPGVNTYGNAAVTSVIDGYCRSFNIIRPVQVPVTLSVELRVSDDKFGCPSPSMSSVKSFLISEWEATRFNGQNVTPYSIRSIIETQFTNMEVVSIMGSRPSEESSANSTVEIGFIEMAELTDDLVTVGVI